MINIKIKGALYEKTSYTNYIDDCDICKYYNKSRISK